MNRGLRKFFVNRLIKKLNTETEYLGWENVETVLILADLVDVNHRSNIEALQKAVMSKGKKTQVLYHMPIKSPKENALSDVYYKNNVNIYGKPKAEIFKTLTKNTDVLIDWSKLEKSPNDFIALQHDAKLKIGINKSLPCFALTVSENGQKTEEVVNEILKYLNLINK